MNAMTKAALAQRNGVSVREWDAEHDEEDTGVTVQDALKWMRHVIGEELDGDHFYKSALENLLEELEDMIDREDKIQRPVSAAVRTVADMYEDDIKEFKEEVWW